MIKRYGIRARGKRGAAADRKSESALAGARQSRARDLPDSVAANLIDKRLSSRG